MPKINLTKSNVYLILILLIGSILRLYNITSVSLWHDEAFSALLIRYPFWEMINRIILDVHPPLYYILLRIWDIILGDNLLSLRLFSAFFGILTVYFTYLFIQAAFKNIKLSLIAAALIAINPFQIQYAAEARMYTLGTFLIMLSSWLLVKALENNNFQTQELSKNTFLPPLEKSDWLDALADEKSAAKNKLAKLAIKIKKYRWWLLYGIISSLAIYTHYYLIFSVAAQALFIIYWALKNYGLNIKEWAKSKNIKGAVIAYAASLTIFLPWLPILLRQLGQVEENYWIPEMNRYSIPGTIFHLFTGTNIYTNNVNLIIASSAFIAIFAAAIKLEKNNYKWLIAFSFIVPFLIAIILSFQRSLYLDRYFVFVGLFYAVILAMFLESIKKNMPRNILFGVIAIGSILLFARGWQKINPGDKPGMAGAAKYLFENIAPEDKVYINSSFIYFTYKYYAYRNYFGGNGYPSNFNPSEIIQQNNVFADTRIYPEYMTPLLYTPGASYSQMPHFSGTALLTEDDTINDFNKNRRRGEAVWIIWTTGFGSGKPADIPKNWIQTDEAGFQDVFDYRGWIVVTKYKVQ